MIVRILGEGQFELSQSDVDALNELDAKVESAVESGDEETFRSALHELLEAVRSGGTRLADDSLEDSDLILPPSDASLDEVRQMLADDGLIPG